jgi:hypothetical protein
VNLPIRRQLLNGDADLRGVVGVRPTMVTVRLDLILTPSHTGKPAGTGGTAKFT